jgi:hypothetical protein
MSNQQQEQLVVIPNTVAPYGYELVDILAYPTGFLQRFRFESEWVDFGTKGAAAAKGSPGYIVLRDKAEAKLYPIRKFSVVSLNQVGSVFYLECELGELFDFDSNKEHRDEQLQEIGQSLSRAHKNISRTNIAGEDMKPLMFFTRVLPNPSNNQPVSEVAKDEHERWSNIISCVADVKFYEHTEFLKVFPPNEFGNTSCIARTVSSSFELKPGLDYAIQVAQYRPGGVSKQRCPRDIELSCDGKTVLPVRAKQRAVGKYDILNFVLRVDPSTPAKNSFFELRFTPEDGAEAHINPSLYFPLTIRLPFKRLIRQVALTSIFLGIYLLPNLSPYFSTSIVSFFDKEFVNDMALVALILTTVDLLAELRKR